MSVKEPWDEKWKTNCRTKIKGRNGVIALISKNTAKADGAKWESSARKMKRYRSSGCTRIAPIAPPPLPSLVQRVS